MEIMHKSQVYILKNFHKGNTPYNLNQIKKQILKDPMRISPSRQFSLLRDHCADF